MSHTVKVNMTSDQEIEVAGEKVNVHDIDTVFVDPSGRIARVFTVAKCSCGDPGTERTDHGVSCGVHCDRCFGDMVDQCRSKSW